MDEALAISLAGVPHRDDAELARAATEDRAAFVAIYERHRTPVNRRVEIVEPPADSRRWGSSWNSRIRSSHGPCRPSRP